MKRKIKKGFSLVEVTVSVVLFSISFLGLFGSVYSIIIYNNKLEKKEILYSNLTLLESRFKDDPKEFISYYFIGEDYTQLVTRYFLFNDLELKDENNYDYKIDLKIDKTQNIIKLYLTNITLKEGTIVNIYNENNYISTFYIGEL